MLIFAKGVTSKYFHVKSFDSMLNIFILLLCMFLMCTMSSFVISSQGPLAKFVAVLMLLIGSLV